MKLLTKLIVASLTVLPMQFAFAAGSDSGSSCSPKPCPTTCPKPCPPKPCPPVCFERGYPNDNCCFPSAYNEPANFEMGPCPWDFWVDASFTYWMAYEEGMDLSVSRAEISGANATPSSSFLFQNTQFKPGFKIGLGTDLGLDHWSAFAEYTWFRSRTHTSSGAPPAAPVGYTNPTWAYNNWAMNPGISGASLMNSTWRVNMDTVDLGMMRPYYQGMNLIVSPYGAVRATWIRQNLRIFSEPFLTIETGLAAAMPSSVFHHKSNSWAVGPAGGMQTKWHLGWGFRVEGDCSCSVLFTRYTTVKCSNDPTVVGGHVRAARYTDYDTIRFQNAMNLGLGWGSYFDCRNYHFDLLASYDFAIFWNQNMMRHLVDAVSGELPLATGVPFGASTSPNNLYLQGLTIRAELDF